MENYIDLIIAVLAGLAACTPLAVKLIEYVKKAVRGENWPDLLTMVLKLMEQAETQFKNGADKKAWCIGMIEASAHTVNFQIDMQVVSTMIDKLCDMSKIVNAPVECVAEATEEVSDAELH